MYWVRVVVEGVVGILFDRFYNVETTEPGTTKKKAARTWRDELRLKLYADKIGVYVPADNIRMSLVGTQLRRGAAKILGSDIEKGKGSQYVSLCAGCVWPMPFDGGRNVYLMRKGRPIQWNPQDYYEAPVPVKPSGRRIVRRPFVPTPWSLDFQIQVTDAQLHESKLKDLLTVAGLRCGICAYGPTWGRFVITKWEVRSKPVELPSKKRRRA